MIDAIIHLCLSITLIEKITSLLESLFIFWIIVSKCLMNIILSTLSLKNHMYCHVWCLNVNVKNFKFNLHYFNSAQIWLRFYLDLTQTSHLNLTQMWFKCISVSSVHHHVKMHLISFHFSDILLRFNSDVTDHYSLFKVLMFWIEMYRYFDQDFHWSSEFKVLHNHQRTDLMID